MAQEGFLKIVFAENSADKSVRQRILPFANSELYRVRIKHAAKLTRGKYVKDVYDVALNTEGITYNFQPGDTIGILPSNNPEEIDEIFNRLRCKDIINETCSIILTDPKKARLVSHLPINTTLNDIFTKHIDIRSPPKKTFLKILLKYTEDHRERTTLERLSSPTNSADYIAFISNNGRRLLTILATFPSCKVPIERLLENLPPLQPRPYSISSSPLLEYQLHITFSIEYFQDSIKGVCTGWLENIINPLLDDNKLIENGDESSISFYFRKPNSFRLNLDIPRPIIMIGPGTGVAPFIGFLQHTFLGKKSLNTWLFYGCRYRDRDYLYKDDVEMYLGENYLRKLSLACSRDQDMKVYVQDLIKNEPGEIYKKLVEEKAAVYICGDLKDMMASVKGAIKYCLINGGMSGDEADLFLSDMIKSNRYIEDKWI